MSTSRIPSRRFSPSLLMESPEAVSSGFLSLPPEPPDPDLDEMPPVDPPVPPIPPDPPPNLLDAGVLSVHLLLMHPLLEEDELSSSLTIRRVSSFLQLVPVSKPRNLVSVVKQQLTASLSSLRNLSFYQQVEVVIEISVARFLGLQTADCKLIFLHYSSLQVLDDWTSYVEILAVVVCRYAIVITSVQLFGVQLSIAMCSSQSKPILHLKPWSHAVGPISPCSRLSQGMVFTSYWSESFLFNHYLQEDFNYLSRRSVFLCKQEIMLFLNGSLPRIEDFINPLSFRFKLHLPQYVAVIWTSSFGVMDIISVEFVENFPTGSASGTWIMSSTQSIKTGTLQKAPPSSLSSGLFCLQILADSTVPFFASRSRLVWIEITGFFIVRNLVPLVIPLSWFYNLCITFCLMVVAFVMGGVPKLCSSNTLV